MASMANWRDTPSCMSENDVLAPPENMAEMMWLRLSQDKAGGGQTAARSGVSGRIWAEPSTQFQKHYGYRRCCRDMYTDTERAALQHSRGMSLLVLEQCVAASAYEAAVAHGVPHVPCDWLCPKGSNRWCSHSKFKVVLTCASSWDQQLHSASAACPCAKALHILLICC